MIPKDALKTIGFTDKEADIYLALLELGEATVLTISKKSGVKRPTVHVVLQTLEEKGFVVRLARAQKAVFLASDPKKLLMEAEFHFREIQEIFPQLESLHHKKKGQPRLIVYEGKERLDQSYDDMFLAQGEALFIGAINLSKEAFPATFRKLEYRPRSEHFRFREILSDNEAGRTYAKTMTQNPFHQIRFLPIHLNPLQNDIGIYGDRVLVSSLAGDCFVGVFESQEIAQSFRTMFELMWAAVIHY